MARAKGITPIISIIVLLLIMVALAGAAWTYISGFMGAYTTKVIDIPPGSSYFDGNNVKIMLRNIGTSAISTGSCTTSGKTVTCGDITITREGSAYDVDIRPSAASISPKGSITITDYNCQAGNVKYIITSPTSTYEVDVNADTLCSPVLSCKDTLNRKASKGDGVYWIDPDGAGGNDPFQAYCDMTTDGGGWTLVANIAPADGNSVGYNNQAFWTTNAEYGSFTNKFSNDYKSPSAYLLNGNYLMIQSTDTGASGSILGWRRWPLTSTRSFDSFFSTGIVAVHGTDSCETGSANAVNLGTTNSWDDIIRQGTCLYADVNPSSSGEGDTIRLTTIPYDNTDNNMAGFASCIDCGAAWQGSNSYMGIDRAGCNSGGCAYNTICRMPSADCLGAYCTNPTYSTTSCGTGWNSRFYVK